MVSHKFNLAVATCLFLFTACYDPAVGTVTPPDSGSLDSDGDGYSPGQTSATDCDDHNNSVHPGAEETCDGRDNDCDGAADEDALEWYPDADRDGFGALVSAVMACAAPGVEWVHVSGDCDDARPDVNPGAAEQCDGLDTNCDGSADDDELEWFPDVDRDGYGAITAAIKACAAPGVEWSQVSGDCDDGRPGVNPGAEELCDGLDNNCDGEADEEGLTTFFLDGDGDGHGRPDTLITSCVAEGSHWVALGDDCDDLAPETFPGAPEICDGRDNNCDGAIDEGLDELSWYVDLDADGFGDPSSEPVNGCSTDTCLVNNALDCNDKDQDSHPGAEETCDGRDNDCDGEIDEGAVDMVQVFTDGDGDGIGSAPAGTMCEPSAELSTLSGDCDDDDASAAPGQGELCDGRDNDCDGAADDGFDLDLDGVTTCAGDCDDTHAESFEGAPEGCDLLDNNCDGAVDEGYDEDADGFTVCAERPDCDDADASIHPDAHERADGRDEDCDGAIDDGYLFDVFPGSAVNVGFTQGGVALSDEATPFEFLWVALADKGTVLKIHTLDGSILAEYATSPDGMGANPSRTTVDRDGNVWVNNRDEDSEVDLDGDGVAEAAGSITRIGLLENGQCQDRNGNGVIDTSVGVGDVMAWGDEAGTDQAGGVMTAQDECIINFVRVHGLSPRHISVDPDNNVWVGGYYDTHAFDLISGEDGRILRSYRGIGVGGFGGFIDAGGIVWSATSLFGLLRWDARTSLDTCQQAVWPEFSPECTIYPGSAHGVGLADSGEVWATSFDADWKIRRFSPDGTRVDSFDQGCMKGRGIAVDGGGDVWYACSDAGTIKRMSPDGQIRATVTVGDDPTGVAVDARGRIWTVNRMSRSLMRIDPDANKVDLTTTDLGGEPYTYSDMTGSTLLAPPSRGSWTFVYDAGAPGAQWGTLEWNSDDSGAYSNGDPSDGELSVEAVTSDDLEALPELTRGVVQSGAVFPGSPGRYLLVHVTLSRAASGQSPVLEDITAWPWVDSDGDGFSAPQDCSDSDGSRSPEALEILDGVDNNCDGLVDQVGGGAAP